MLWDNQIKDRSGEGASFVWISATECIRLCTYIVQYHFSFFSNALLILIIVQTLFLRNVFNHLQRRFTFSTNKKKKKKGKKEKKKKKRFRFVKVCKGSKDYVITQITVKDRCYCIHISPVQSIINYYYNLLYFSVCISTKWFITLLHCCFCCLLF